MKNLMSYLVVLLGSMSLYAMQAPPAAATRSLIIDNKFLDTVEVQFQYHNSGPIKQLVRPEEQFKIPDIRRIDDIRLQVYGKYLSYLNFANSPNYRTLPEMERLVATVRDQNIVLKIEPTELLGKIPRPIAPIPGKEPEQPSGWIESIKKMGSDVYQGAVSYSQKVVSRFAPFTISLEAVSYTHLGEDISGDSLFKDEAPFADDLPF